MGSNSKYYEKISIRFLVGAVVLLLAGFGFGQTETLNSEISVLPPLLFVFGIACIFVSFLFLVSSASESS